jgi:nucleotide-binding universal stress UspA family protein
MGSAAALCGSRPKVRIVPYGHGGTEGLRPDRNGFSAIVFRSETMKVLTHSTVPVLVVRET